MVLRIKEPLPEQGLHAYTSGKKNEQTNCRSRQCRASGSILAAGRRWSSPELSHRDQNFPSVDRARRVAAAGRRRGTCPARRPRGDGSGPGGERFPRRKGAMLLRLTGRARPARGENAELRTTLAVRDAVIKWLEVRLAERERRPPTISTPGSPPASAELASLRREIAELRDGRSFEAKRALFQADPASRAPPASRRPRRGARSRCDLRRRQGAGRPAAACPAPAPSPSTSTSPAPRLTPGGQIHAAAAAVHISDLHARPRPPRRPHRPGRRPRRQPPPRRPPRRRRRRLPRRRRRSARPHRDRRQGRGRPSRRHRRRRPRAAQPQRRDQHPPALSAAEPGWPARLRPAPRPG